MHGGGDLELAKSYVERVATSNSTCVMQATELLKKIKAAIIVRHATVEVESAEQRAQAQAQTQATLG